ncbi:MAG TPA: hypothetical protein DIW30_03260 [Bacteroidales bacterium]|nr:hypothetical protein [Bacteroidales bacterium]
MKKILGCILLLMLLFLSSVQAQNPVRGISFDASVAMGYSSLGHKTSSSAYPGLEASHVGDYGASAYIGANIFFTHVFGLSLGCGFSRYGGAVKLSGKQTWQGVTDTDGELYNHTFSLYRWRERQQQLFLSPQFLLLFAIPANMVRVQIGVGAEYDICLRAFYRASGDLEHTGTYLPWNLTLHDVDTHGFYRNKSFRPHGTLPDGGKYVSVVAKVGVLLPLARNLDLSLNLVGKYAVYADSKTAVQAGGNLPVGFREDAESISAEAVRAHAFMSQYASLFQTGMVRGSYCPLFVGMEVGIRYTIPFRKHYPCRCIAN